MAEIILISILAFLVVALSASILIRRHRSKGRLLLDEAAITDLIASVTKSATGGRIQDTAAVVSDILKKHLQCDRIVFLKYYRSNLELNYFSGLERIDRNDFRIRLNPALQKKLKSFSKVSSVIALKALLSDRYVERLKKQDLRYFFPVFQRNNLYGIYLIRTDLPPDNALLNLLATTLAFNLSTAYHIGRQDQKIAKYEDRMKETVSAKAEKFTLESVPPSGILKYLKIRKYQHLLPELLKMLKKDCNFTKLGFCVRSDTQETQFLSVAWNIPEEAGKIIEDSYEPITRELDPDKIHDLKKISKLESLLQSNLKMLSDKGISYMMSIPWVNKTTAVLAWSGKNGPNEIVERIRRFQREALPLVENISRLEKAEELSYTDGLTGMYNFRYFEKRINEEFHRARRYNRHLALLIFDIDDLKPVNDKYGHLAGDTLIKSFGKSLKQSVRSNDVISRYGGDEFCLIMPDTNREDAKLFMERMRNKIVSGNSYIDWADTKLEYTVSTGGAVYPLDAESIEGLIHAADMALLRAKGEGRNRSKLYQPEFDRKG